MKLEKAKELASKILKTGITKIYIDPTKTSKVKEAMTKDDVRGLIAERIIKKRQDNYQSKARARVLKEKKQKGRRKGKGKRKGTKKTRVEKKKNWISKVRAQRKTLKELKKSHPKEVSEKGYSNIYKKIKGNYFKGKKYLRNFIEGVKDE